MWMHKLRLAALALLTLIAFAGAGVWAGRPAVTGSAPPAKLKADAQPPQKSEEKKAADPVPPADTKEKRKKQRAVLVTSGLEIRDALRKTIDWSVSMIPRQP